MPQPAAPPTHGAADLTGRKLGRYEVLLMLASGGMASVYIARAMGVAGFERVVAIKVLHPHIAHDEEFISMFLDEARLAARIRHPNAVGTLDISDTQGDGYFLVMDYVEGDHFGHLLRNAAKGGERLPVPVVARIIMDGLAGLQAAHELTDSNGARLDLVHRDVSPHNLLVGTDGVARITDFGIAKAQVRLSSTRDGQFKGKLSYMAPEQAASGQADQRSDLFSMGIVLWEALTGRRLFRGENNADVLNKILNPEVPPPSEFDSALAPFDAVIAQALAADPDDRFQSAEEFLDAVEEAAAPLGGVATPRSVAREVNKWLGDKVERDRVKLTAAIDAAGRSELTPGVLPRPMESGSQPTSPSQVRAIGPDATVGARPSTLASQQPAAPSRSRLTPVLIAIVASGLIGGIAGAWVIFGTGTDPEDETPTQPVEQVAAPPTSEPTEVAGAADEEPTPAATEEPSAGTDEALETGQAEEDEETASTVAERRRGRRARRGRRSRRARARRGRSGSEEQNQASPPDPTPPPDDSSDDDLMLNPYR